MRTVLVSMVLAACLSAGAAVAGPLHDAARAGDADAAFALVDAGAEVDELDETGATPLFLAAEAGSFSVVDQLILHQVDMSVRNKDGLTPLHGSAVSGNSSVMSFFISGEDHNPRVIIDIDDNANLLGLTPMMVAAEHGKIDLVAYLISWHADVEKTDAAGRSVLTRVGAKGGEDKIVTVLLRSHATCQEIDPAWYAECVKRKTALGL